MPALNSHSRVIWGRDSHSADTTRLYRRSPIEFPASVTSGDRKSFAVCQHRNLRKGFRRCLTQRLITIFAVKAVWTVQDHP